MKASKTNLLGTLVILGMLLITLVIVFNNNELETVMGIIASLDPLWMIGAALCWLGYLFFDGLGFYRYLKKRGYPVTPGYALYVSLMGAFYSGVTPGSSGGQPMQIYYLKKRQVPISVSTSVISIKFILGQLATVVLVPILWIVNRDFVNAQLGGVRWLIFTGWFIHLVGVILTLMITFCRPMILRPAHWLVKKGVKLRLIRDEQTARDKLERILDSFHANVLTLGKDPMELLSITLTSMISLFLLMSVIVCVYEAFRQSGARWRDLITAAYMLYLSASFNPLPGASGAQEGGFLVFYRGLFAPGEISLAMLVWRFISYYLSLLGGAAALLVKTFRRKKEKQNASPE